MSDTKDIKALRERLAVEANRVRDQRYVDEHCCVVNKRDLLTTVELLDQLEAERQRADKAELELIKPLPIGELIQRLEGQTYEKWFSQSDLKAGQVPFMFAICHPDGSAWMDEGCVALDQSHLGVVLADLRRDTGEDYHMVPVFTAQQKPVAIDADIIRDANRYRFLRDEDAWGEDSDSWDVETRTGLISSENLMGGLSPDHFDAAVDARMAASDIPFFNPATATQKPVIVTRPPMDDIYHNKLTVWIDGFNYASKGYDANIEAAGGIVKDGE